MTTVSQIPLSAPAASKTDTLLCVLRALQSIDSEFPIQYALCLCEIAKNEGCSLTDLSEKTGLALSTISRIVGALSSFRQRGTPYEFITMHVSETERRRKELYLTDRGRAALAQITAPL